MRAQRRIVVNPKPEHCFASLWLSSEFGVINMNNMNDINKIMKKGLIVLMLVLLTFTVIKPVFAEEKSSNENIVDKLIDEAISNNPELKAFEEKINVFKERPLQAGSLDDPRIRLSLLSVPTDSFSFAQESMTQKQLAIMQKFPYPGKLKLRSSIAQQELEAVKEEFADNKNKLIMQVKVAYNDLIFIDKSIEITIDNRDLLKEFVKIAETKYAVGTGIQQDVLKSQVELSIMIDRLIRLDQKRKTVEARLNTLLNRPVRMPFVQTGEIKKRGFKISFEGLQEVAEKNHPMLVGLKHMIKRYRFSYDLAKRDYYPDPDVGVSYGQRDDGPQGGRADIISAFVTLNLPVWYKTKESRKVAEEKAKIRRTKEQYNSMRNNVFFDIRDIMARIEKHDEEIDLFKTGLIPQSRSSLESAISGYTVNKVDFLTLVDNQITLFNYEIDYYRAITNYENTLAELEAAVGKRLF